MSEPLWIEKDVVLAIHDELLAREGGLAGLRDENLLESALGRPINLYAYTQADTFALAASYAYGLCNNHPFIDGNKRIAFMVCSLFLEEATYLLQASREEKIETFLELANGNVSEKQLELWIRKNSVKC